MTDESTGWALSARSASQKRPLIVALCAVALGIFSPTRGAAQITYNDFNVPQAAGSQTSTSCATLAASPAASGVLFCFNSALGSVSPAFLTDTYPQAIDPTGGTGSTQYALQLTPSQGSQATSVWYTTPQNVANGFTAWYAFKIVPGSSPYGDGLAFVIQNALGNGTDPYSPLCLESGSGPTALGGGGGCLGYGGIDNSVAIEADTFTDSYDPWDLGFGSYDDNHIALQDCGPGLANSTAHYVSNSVSPLVPTSCLVSLGGTYAIASNPSSNIADRSPHQVVVVYNGPNDSPANTIYVYLDPALNPGTHTPVAGSTPLSRDRLILHSAST